MSGCKFYFVLSATHRLINRIAMPAWAAAAHKHRCADGALPTGYDQAHGSNSASSPPSEYGSLPGAYFRALSTHGAVSGPLKQKRNEKRKEKRKRKKKNREWCACVRTSTQNAFVLSGCSGSWRCANAAVTCALCCAGGAARCDAVRRQCVRVRAAKSGSVYHKASLCTLTLPFYSCLANLALCRRGSQTVRLSMHHRRLPHTVKVQKAICGLALGYCSLTVQCKCRRGQPQELHRTAGWLVRIGALFAHCVRSTPQGFGQQLPERNGATQQPPMPPGRGGAPQHNQYGRCVV